MPTRRHERFISLKTLFWLCVVFISLLFLGSLIISKELAFFSGINDTPLFKWLAQAKKPNITWWIFGLILASAILAINTIICSIESLIKKINRANLLLKISPQIMHLGVLFIMLGHLLTASYGFKEDISLKKGETVTASGVIKLTLKDLEIKTDEEGYPADWKAEVWWGKDSARVKRDILRPSHPTYFEGLGLYINSVSLEPEPSVLFRICQDPGALWALSGGIIISIGGILFIYARFRT